MCFSLFQLKIEMAWLWLVQVITPSYCVIYSYILLLYPITIYHIARIFDCDNVQTQQRSREEEDNRSCICMHMNFKGTKEN